MSPLVWANQVTVVAKTKLITAVYLTLVNVLLFCALKCACCVVCLFFGFFFLYHRQHLPYQTVAFDCNLCQLEHVQTHIHTI